MNESTWLTCTNPHEMLTWCARPRGPFLGASTGDPRRPNVEITPRKLRLFAVACARLVWDQLTNPRSRNAVEVAERFADGQATDAELADGYEIAPAYFNNAEPHWGLLDLGWVCCGQVRPDRTDITGFFSVGNRVTALDADFAAILRGMLGNPYQRIELPEARPRCPCCRSERFALVPITTRNDLMACKDCYAEWNWPADAYRCPWFTPDALDLAQAAYETRDRACLACNRWTDCSWCKNTRRLPRENGILDPFRLGLVADALEEAGCPQEVHCPDCLGNGVATWSWDQAVQAWILVSNSLHPHCPAPVPPDAPGKRQYQPCITHCRNRTMTHPLLAQLRSPEPQYRGMHTLDLILGRE